MATFVLIHGAGDVGWYWHLVERELEGQGHEVIALDLPCDDDTAGLWEYADAVIAAIGDRSDVIVVGQSFGGFTPRWWPVGSGPKYSCSSPAWFQSRERRLRTGSPTRAGSRL